MNINAIIRDTEKQAESFIDEVMHKVLDYSVENNESLEEAIARITEELNAHMLSALTCGSSCFMTVALNKQLGITIQSHLGDFGFVCKIRAHYEAKS